MSKVVTELQEKLDALPESKRTERTELLAEIAWETGYDDLDAAQEMTDNTSGVTTVRSPSSTTACPICRKRSAIPAMRIANGPIACQRPNQAELLSFCVCPNCIFIPIRVSKMGD